MLNVIGSHRFMGFLKQLAVTFVSPSVVSCLGARTTLVAHSPFFRMSPRPRGSRRVKSKLYACDSTSKTQGVLQVEASEVDLPCPGLSSSRPRLLDFLDFDLNDAFNPSEVEEDVSLATTPVSKDQDQYPNIDIEKTTNGSFA